MNLAGEFATMTIKKISPRIFVAGQISSSHISAIAARGIKTIISNRPDNESQGQPAASDIAVAAEALDIAFLNVPVAHNSITDADVEDFERACRDAAEPILAYCRSGMRSTILWALSQAKLTEIDEILSATSEAGYDLSKLRSRLAGQAAAAAAAGSIAADPPD